MTVRHVIRAGPVRPGRTTPPALHEPAEAIVDDDPARVVDRPDGFHWIALDGRQEFGPFETRDLALADMAAGGEPAAAPQSMLQEVERDLGIADWIDPETGEPAEGACPPHLDED
jgi:hypothetical protein